METKFKIAKYNKTENGFEISGYDEYSVTYLKDTKLHKLRIVVNGYLTMQTINLALWNSGYKKLILLAVKEYLEKGINSTLPKVNKKVTIDYLNKLHGGVYKFSVKNHLLTITKEESRDRLTEFGLI
jgi:hypothetical protein